MPSPPLTALATAVLRVPGAPERVLEVECGEGERTLFLAREYPGARVRGADGSEATVRAAAGRVGLDPEGRIAFKRGRPGALPYPDDNFDLVAQCSGRVAAAELARVLRPGGHALLVGRWRWLDWRLRMHGFDALQPGEAEGLPYLLARLREDGGRRE